MAKINILLLLVLFNVLSCLKLMRSLDSHINDFIQQVKDDGHYYILEKMKYLNKGQTAYNYCRDYYSKNDCEQLVYVYMKAASL